MQTYTVTINHTETATIEIDAESEEQARDIALEKMDEWELYFDTTDVSADIL